MESREAPKVALLEEGEETMPVILRRPSLENCGKMGTGTGTNVAGIWRNLTAVSCIATG